MSIVVDRKFWPTLLDLRTCLCDELARSVPDLELCSCAVIPGEPDLTLVRDGVGVAWVRLVAISAVPSGADSTPCGMIWQAQVQIGVVRCAPVPDRFGNISNEQWESATETVLADQAAMLRALCCVKVNRASWSGGAYAPYGPEGGAMGGAWSFVLEEQT